MQSSMRITGRRVDLAVTPVESARDRILSADLLCLLAETCLRQSGWLPLQILGTGMHAVCGSQLQVTTGSHLVPLDLEVRCSQQEQDHNFTQAVQNYQTSGRPSLLFHIVPAQANWCRFVDLMQAGPAEVYSGVAQKAVYLMKERT